MANNGMENVLHVLGELKEDNTVPRNVRAKIDEAIKILNDGTDIQIKVSRVLSELEEISDDVNLQSYTRTQIWDAISGLEKVK